MYRALLTSMLMVVFCISGPTTANADKHILDTAERLLSIPEQKIDLAYSKLTIDNLVDPRVSIASILTRLDAMIATINGMADVGASDDQKLAAIRTYLYRPGPWNDNQPFKYDLKDPLGRHIPSKLLQNYMDSKLGNCVSMPFLFIALADRMGLNVTASTAPEHVFVRYISSDGKTINLETTSGAHPSRNEWIRKNMPMTDLAIRNGVYLKTLSKKETVVVMAMVLLEDAMKDGRYGTVLNLTDIMLRHYPNYAPLHVHRGSAAYKILEKQFYSQYPTPADIPYEKRGFFQHMNVLNRAAFQTAEQLGWRQGN